MMLSKKGNVGSIKTQTLAVVLGVISVVILVAIAPELWTVLNTAFGNETDGIIGADIPFISGLTGVLGLLFGVVIFLGAVYGMFKMFSSKR